MTAETVVIDLGLDRGEPQDYAAPARSTMPRWFAPVLAALALLAGATASAAPPPPALTPLMTIRVGPADPYTITAGGALLAQTVGTLASYSMADGRQQWQAGIEFPAYRLTTGNGVLLLRNAASAFGRSSGTRAVSLTDGSRRWVRNSSVMAVQDTGTLLGVQYERASGPNPRIRGQVEAIDASSGRARWTVGIPRSAVIFTVPARGDEAARMLLVHDDRKVTLHDLTTGTELASGTLPAADYKQENPTVVGGLLLLRYPDPAEREGRLLTAYDTTTLRPVWTRAAPEASYGEIAACGEYACTSGYDGVRALDLADGSQRWYRPGWRDIRQQGQVLVAYGNNERETEPVGIVDPRSGDLVTDLTGWEPVNGQIDDHLLVTRPVENGTRTMVAVAYPGQAQPRLLDDLPVSAGDCRTAPGRLVCRSTAGDLTMWAYQQRD
jgi:outer membrane protein assembly factor BamB